MPYFILTNNWYIMINYEFYKLLHIFSLIFIVLCLTANTLLAKPSKWARITGMVASLFLFIAGMGLLARTGHAHNEAWPIWVQLKVFIWLVLAILGPILIKRLPQLRTKILIVALFLLMMAIALAIFKPFI